MLHLPSFSEKRIDWSRTRNFTATSIVLAPTVHYWYIFLDSLFVGHSAPVLLKKLLFDAFMFSPIYISLFYLFQSRFEQTSVEDSLGKLSSSGGVLWVGETLLWTPLQYVNFRFVPLSLRVAYDNLVSFCFDIFYSTVYHHQVTFECTDIDKAPCV